MQIAIDVRSAEVISRAFFANPDMVVDELETAMTSAVAYLDRETRERTPAASGALRQAWVSDVRVLYGAVIGTLSNPLPYAIPVELGSKPHFPPVDAIQNWVEVKLNLYGSEAESVALSIARKIAQRGTLAAGMAHLALAHGRETVADEFRAAAQRIASRLAGGVPGGAA